jgi:hygromycin-B 4-O-kinase
MADHHGRFPGRYQPFRTAYARLEELVTGLPTPRHIVHQDLLNRNVLVQGSEITAVIDWGNSLYGDCLYDAAWLIFWWPWFPAWQAIDISTELHRHWAQYGGIPVDVEHGLLAYLMHIGLEAMSYSVFRRRWADLARTADQVRELVRTS